MRKALTILGILLVAGAGFYFVNKEQYISGQAIKLKDPAPQATTSTSAQPVSSVQKYVPPTTSDPANPYFNVKVGDQMGAFTVTSKEPYSIKLSGQTDVRGTLVYEWGEYNPEWFCLEVASADRQKIPSGKPIFCMKGTMPAAEKSQVTVRIQNYEIYAGEKEGSDTAEFIALVK